jgi:transcription antitermination factor NusG
MEGCGLMTEQSCAAVSARELEARWYAVYTKSRHEKSVAELLTRRFINVFVPLYTTVRRWRNGPHEVQLPLFAGYAFVHIALRERLEVLRVPGVARLIGFNGMPTPLPDREIERLRQTLANGTKAEPHPFLNVGRRVRIRAGSLAGCEGILVRRQGNPRVVLSIELIQRSVLVEVEASSLEPIYSTPLPAQEGIGAPKYATDGRYL